jgi:hypothetical protein
MENFAVTWKCSQCGQSHDEPPRSYGFDSPLAWHLTPEANRRERSELHEEFCILNDKDFFVRGSLEIPVVDSESPFVWDVWVSLSAVNFERTMSLMEDQNRTAEQPYFGWLSSRIQIYPDTYLLKTRVHTRELGMRPFVELEPTDHPLAVEQRKGITEDRVREIAALTEHGWIHPQWNCSS